MIHFISPRKKDRVNSTAESVQKHNPGLYVISTPIGNLLDLSQRAIHILEHCDIVLSEDTRVTVKLLNAYGIKKQKKQLLSYHKFNEEQRIADFNFSDVKKHIIALVSDAGTPTIADPGSKIVAKCHQLKLPVFSVPGCCSVMAGFSISGLELKTNQFLYFAGFFPRKKKDANELLEKASQIGGYIICFEAAKRLETFLEIISSFFEDDLTIFIAKEMTKIHEATLRGTCSKILAELRENEQKKEQFSKGEIVVIIDMSVVKQTTGDDKEIEFWSAALKPHLKNTVLAKILSKRFGKNRQNLYSKLIK